MTVTQTSQSVVTQAGGQFSLSSLFTPGPGLPAAIGVDIYDDGNYTASNLGGLGYLSGNGARSANTIVAPDGEDFGYVIFQYDAKTGQYYNSSLGYWNDITYVAPTGSDHAETLSVFSFKNGTSFTLSNVTDYGDLSIVTEGAFTNPFPGAVNGQGTPEEICAIAQSYVGKVWNNEGCALLVQVVAGLAGSSLPISVFATSHTDPTPAQPNGEWVVAYDGHIQTNPTYAAVEAIVRPGDVVSLGWTDGSGHDFIVVSGSGADAQVIDNSDFGTNSAHDGSSSDIIIQPAHSLDALLQQEGSAIPASIEVYRLDTPVITAQASPVSLPAQSHLALAGLITASDPAGKAITAYQLYDSAGSHFIVGGADETAQSAATALSVDSLAGVALVGGTSSGSDTVEVRAFNGTYWGDWQAVTVAGAPALTASQAIGGAADAGSVVVDSAQNVAASLDGLSALAAKGDLASITLTDSGTPNLSVTAAQWSADSAALNEISSSHTVTLTFSGDAAQHDFSADTLAGVSAVQFADQTVIVAATPGPANAVTTGNITELYAAVFSREPDVGGLAFYQNFLKSNPGAPLLTFADYFLNSTEYQNNTAHDYAQTIAGDTQFIEDSYQNLLHRTPSAGEVSFYLTNVMNKPDAHALMLVYFSASAEFLGNVQITAQNAASAQHWLLLT